MHLLIPLNLDELLMVICLSLQVHDALIECIVGGN